MPISDEVSYQGNSLHILPVRKREEFQQTLKHLGVHCVVVSAMRELRSVLPSLKPAVKKYLKSRVVYKITCSQCSLCYVGQTDRHVSTRFKEQLIDSLRDLS